MKKKQPKNKDFASLDYAGSEPTKEEFVKTLKKVSRKINPTKAEKSKK